MAWVNQPLDQCEVEERLIASGGPIPQFRPRCLKRPHRMQFVDPKALVDGAKGGKDGEESNDDCKEEGPSLASIGGHEELAPLANGRSALGSGKCTSSFRMVSSLTEAP